MSADNFKCEACNKKFSGETPYEEHLNSKKHMKTSVPQNVELHCIFCVKDFTGVEPYFMHVASDEHLRIVRNTEIETKAKLLVSYKNMEDLKENVCVMMCPECNVPFTSWENADAHFRSNGHVKRVSDNEKSNVLRRYKPKQPSPKSENSLQGTCNICNVPLSGEKAIEQHKKGKKHMKRLEQLNEMGEANTDKNTKSTSKFEEKCQVCNVFLSGRKAVQEHFVGKKHRKKLAKLHITCLINSTLKEVQKPIDPDEQLKQITKVNMEKQGMSEPEIAKLSSACLDMARKTSVLQKIGSFRQQWDNNGVKENNGIDLRNKVVNEISMAKIELSPDSSRCEKKHNSNDLSIPLSNRKEIISGTKNQPVLKVRNSSISQNHNINTDLLQTENLICHTQAIATSDRCFTLFDKKVDSLLLGKQNMSNNDKVSKLRPDLSYAKVNFESQSNGVTSLIKLTSEKDYISMSSSSTNQEMTSEKKPQYNNGLKSFLNTCELTHNNTQNYNNISQLKPVSCSAKVNSKSELIKIKDPLIKISSDSEQCYGERRESFKKSNQADAILAKIASDDTAYWRKGCSFCGITAFRDEKAYRRHISMETHVAKAGKN